LDFFANTVVTNPTGQNFMAVPNTIKDNALDEGIEIMSINLQTPYTIYNNFTEISVLDYDFMVAPYSAALSSIYGRLASTQPIKS